VMAVLGRIPVPGDVVDGEGHRIEVLRMDGRRVARVRITRRPPGGGAAPPRVMAD